MAVLQKDKDLKCITYSKKFILKLNIYIYINEHIIYSGEVTLSNITKVLAAMYSLDFVITRGKESHFRREYALIYSKTL